MIVKRINNDVYTLLSQLISHFINSLIKLREDRNKMTKYVLGALGFATLVTDKPLYGADVYRVVTDDEAEKLATASASMERVHHSQLDSLLSK